MNSSYKFYFVIMQNLDFFKETDIVFKYDLKFSEVNRQSITNINDVCFVFEYFIMESQKFNSLLNFRSSMLENEIDSFRKVKDKDL